ncbi:MAG: DNA alkylation repair protein [Clostridia bacterium]|nr:DNA alkylation repair protein [Clostridia bacterium]
MNAYNLIIEKLKGVANLKYRDFSSKIANSNKEMLGVKIPTLKVFAKEILKADYKSFLKDCKFKYFEDTLLFGLIIARLNYDEFLFYLPTYLEKVDSWSHVDSFVCAIKSVPKNKDDFLNKLKKEISEAKDFRLRFYIICLMNFYLDCEHLDYVFSTLEKCDGKGYYNDMAIAWLISVAFVKFEGQTFQFIKNCKLSNFTLNKAISKIRDSFRVSRENKILLQNYIRKN